ncbi:MAG: hypothetical protein F4Y75_00755 [Acidimicrobiia bacterium]|nr:hypothetical protein [Acidimicrobiia bacterium]
MTPGVRTNRGFTALVNHSMDRLEISFDHSTVDLHKNGAWLEDVRDRVGLGELDPQPYWGFEDLFHKAGTKLNKTVYAIAERRRKDRTEFFRYSHFFMLEGFRRERLIRALELGNVRVDFDARTGHNHGTKFRLRQEAYRSLYDTAREV